ncbi:MAG: hypothetical protein ACQKBW_11170 [Puniceicoccales bacterium]
MKILTPTLLVGLAASLTATLPANAQEASFGIASVNGQTAYILGFSSESNVPPAPAPFAGPPPAPRECGTNRPGTCGPKPGACDRPQNFQHHSRNPQQPQMGPQFEMHGPRQGQQPGPFQSQDDHARRGHSYGQPEGGNHQMASHTRQDNRPQMNQDRGYGVPTQNAHHPDRPQGFDNRQSQSYIGNQPMSFQGGPRRGQMGQPQNAQGQQPYGMPQQRAPHENQTRAINHAPQNQPPAGPEDTGSTPGDPFSPTIR